MSFGSVAIVGATGAVGREFLSILEQRQLPVSNVKLYASKRSTGKRLTLFGEDLEVMETTEESFNNVDVVFISATTEVSLRFAPVAVNSGALVIDDSSAFRMDPDVPLVIPEVNPEDLVLGPGIIAIPNCSTTQMVMALFPLHRVNPIRRIVVDTYQSVSGIGSAAIRELKLQSLALAQGGTYPSQIGGNQIAFNVVPHIDSFLDDGYTKEERKMLEETRKIMHSPGLKVSATCVRVPVTIGHSESIHVEFSHPMSADNARDLLSKFPGITVLDDPIAGQYPMPFNIAGSDDVYVGRVREDISLVNGLALWVVGDNLRKGAALNAIQIAEKILEIRLNSGSTTLGGKIE